MGLLDNLVVSAVAAVVEAYAVRALLPQHDLRSILYIAFGVNSSLCLAWASFIYPVFVNPLRHLPRVGVRPEHGNKVRHPGIPARENTAEMDAHHSQ